MEHLDPKPLKREKTHMWLIIAPIIFCLATTICSIIAIASTRNILNDRVNIKVDDTYFNDFNISLDNFYPGKSKKEEIYITSKVSDSYTLELSFSCDKSSQLNEYINVNVLFNEDNVSFGLLSNYILNGTLEYKCDIYSNKKSLLLIEYSLLFDATNSIMNTSTDFLMNLKLKKE